MLSIWNEMARSCTLLSMCNDVDQHIITNHINAGVERRRQSTKEGLKLVLLVTDSMNK